MNIGLIGEQIAKFRKAAGLTQEDLGKAVGVSTQAVSRWECGGAPDVALLPAIADRLGVTIDTLFGRSEEEIEDMPSMFTRWLDSLPAEQRPDQLFRLLTTHLTDLSTMGHDFYVELPANILPTCFASDRSWMRSGLVTENSICMAIPAEDFPLYMLLPEPPEGYVSQLAANEEYRCLFSALSMEGSLELLRYLYGQKEALYSIPALSSRTGLPQEQVSAVVEAMEKCSLLGCVSIETEDGSTNVYKVHDNGGVVPFLYLARWVMERDDCWVVGWSTRKRPVLALPESNSRRTKEDQP